MFISILLLNTTFSTNILNANMAYNKSRLIRFSIVLSDSWLQTELSLSGWVPVVPNGRQWLPMSANRSPMSPISKLVALIEDIIVWYVCKLLAICCVCYVLYIKPIIIIAINGVHNFGPYIHDFNIVRRRVRASGLRQWLTVPRVGHKQWTVLLNSTIESIINWLLVFFSSTHCTDDCNANKQLTFYIFSRCTQLFHRFLVSFWHY